MRAFRVQAGASERRRGSIVVLIRIWLAVALAAIRNLSRRIPGAGEPREATRIWGPRSAYS